MRKLAPVFALVLLGRSASAEPPPAASFDPPPLQSAPPITSPAPAPPAYGGPGYAPAPAPMAPPAYGAPPALARNEPPAGQAPPARYGFCLGAGVGMGFGQTDAALGVLGALSSSQTTASTPTYLTSFEVRVGDTTWLGLNAAMGHAAYEVPVTGDGTPPRNLQLESNRIAVLLGLRQVIAEGIVDVSLFGALAAAHDEVSGDEPREGEYASVRPGTSADTLALTGGLSVERELVEALALRLSASLFSASLSRADTGATSPAGEPTTTEVHSSRVGLSIAPSLQLHFYF